jgi:hypothetical protein
MRVALTVLVLGSVGMIASNPVAADGHAQTLLEYGAQCAREIGEIPPFDCNDGTDIPITVDGRTPGPDESPQYCDRPSLLSPGTPQPWQCLPHSRILNLSRGATQIAAYCRQNHLRHDPKPNFDQVMIVLHHTGNGKTCWFQSRPATDPDLGINVSRVPPPNEVKPPAGKPAAVEFWMTPGEIAAKPPTCMSCHDAGPFIQSPYIAQVWDKVPTDPWGKYSSIGPAFESHPLRVITTPGNTCTGCHRIGSEQSCNFYIGFSAGKAALSYPHVLPPGNDRLANTYPASHWMPVDNNMSQEEWNAANLKSVEALLSCCRQPDGPDCNVAPISTSDKAGRNLRSATAR